MGCRNQPPTKIRLHLVDASLNAQFGDSTCRTLVVVERLCRHGGVVVWCPMGPTIGKERFRQAHAVFQRFLTFL